MEPCSGTPDSIYALEIKQPVVEIKTVMYTYCDVGGGEGSLHVSVYKCECVLWVSECVYV